MSDNVELVQRIYGSVVSGDIPGVIAQMADDVVIEVPGPSDIPFAGTYRGHDGVAAFFQAIGENAEIKGFEPREFIAQGDDVVVVGREHLTARQAGRSWETDWAMVWTVRDGKVARLREFHQTDAIAAAYR